MEQTSPWRSRITGSGTLKVAEAKPHALNFRNHPPTQSQALAASLDSVGWVQQVVVNTTTGNLLDGHLRWELARQRGEVELPCLFVELSADEERFVLASLDPIAAMAQADRAKLQELLTSLQSEDEQVRGLLEAIARQERIELPSAAGLVDPDEVPEPPGRARDQARRSVAPRRPSAARRRQHEARRGLAPDGRRARRAGGQRQRPTSWGTTGGAHPQSWSNKAAVRGPATGRPTTARPRSAAPAVLHRLHLRSRWPRRPPRTPPGISGMPRPDAQPELAAATAACGLLVHQQIIWVQEPGGARPQPTTSGPMSPACMAGVRATAPARRPPAEARSVWEVPSAIEDGGGGQHPTIKTDRALQASHPLPHARPASSSSTAFWAAAPA